MHTPLFHRLLPIGLLLAASFSTPTLLAQAQFAGTYIGPINTRVTIPIVGTIESAAGAYVATVAADGTISLAGTLTGSVSASSAVTFGGGSAPAALNIRTATIANNQLSSAYGDPVAGSNGTTSFRLNGSTSFTAATGGGGTTGGELLAYYSFNDANNLLRDDSGRGYTLSPVNGTVTRIDGRVGAGALRTNGVRLRALVNSSFSSTTSTLSYFVRPTGGGSWNPRLVSVGPAGSSSHFYGTFLEGTNTGARRIGFLQDGNGSYPAPSPRRAPFRPALRPGRMSPSPTTVQPRASTSTETCPTP